MKAEYCIDNDFRGIYKYKQESSTLEALFTSQEDYGMVTKDGLYDGENLMVGDIIGVWTSCRDVSSWEKLGSNSVTFTW